MAGKVIPKLQFPQCTKRHLNIPPPEAYTSPIVQIFVGTGKDAKTFNIYKGLLEYYSQYFRTALKSSWIEGQTNTVRLNDEDPNVFERFNYWLFSKRLYKKEARPADKPDSVETVPLRYAQICEIFFFADRRGIPELANAALDLWFARNCQEWMISFSPTRAIYANTLEASPLRRLYVDTILGIYSFSDFHKYSDRCVPELLVDIIVTAEKEKVNLFGVKKSQEEYTTETKRVFCEKYHDHTDESQL